MENKNKEHEFRLLPPSEVAFIVIVISLGFALAFHILNTNFNWSITYGDWFFTSLCVSVLVLYLKMKNLF